MVLVALYELLATMENSIVDMLVGFSARDLLVQRNTCMLVLTLALFELHVDHGIISELTVDLSLHHLNELLFVAAQHLLEE